MMKTRRVLLVLVGLAPCLAGCGEGELSVVAEPPPGITSAPTPEDRPPHARQAYFGDLHIHSSWSIDAFATNVRVGPAMAYRYAKGEAIPHYGGTPIRLAGPPLDFMALTDHAEYLGVISATTQTGHPLHSQPLIRTWLGDDPNASAVAWERIRGSFLQRKALPALVEDRVVKPAWQQLVTLANQQDEPGRFTAFIGFEYSSNPDNQNLHRNVIFRGADVPSRPFTSMDSENPEDLWRWMDGARSKGDDLIAIPHNSNGSNGLMFARTRNDGGAIDAAWAEERMRNEPVVEVMQIKGQSETLPSLSPNDEWADFEVAPWRTIDPGLPSQPAGSYVRDALRIGLLFEQELGTNPYAFGLIGSTDGHNASSPFEEDNYTGKIGSLDGTPERRLRGSISTDASGEIHPLVMTYWSAAGLAGIWSDANTRADLFDALRRRETFSTSGPRIQLRLFAGWDFEAAEAVSDIARIGYARGVPMGGDLPEHPADASPTFLLAALKDPREARLERIQIIKGWTQDGQTRERVFDVACADGTTPDAEHHRCPNRGAPPDLTTCESDAASGVNELRSWWRDPEFDPRERAFYYARVLQIPTCRWSTRDANRLGVAPPTSVPAWIQERAITSPVWYAPG